MTTPKIIASASAPCGISVVSSYATGVGAVMAVDRRIRVTLVEASGACRESRTRRLVAAARETLGLIPRPSLTALTTHPLPSGVGLKTSSAVICALNSAMLCAEGRAHSVGRVIDASNKVSRLTGLTQAGSVDDNYATALGGVVVSQTEGAKLLARWESPSDVAVVIAVPRGRGVDRSDRRELLRPYRKRVEGLLESLLRSQNAFSVMSEAAFTHCEALGYSPLPLRAALNAGALGVSLSGKGPALAAVAQGDALDRVVHVWRRALPARTSIIYTRPENIGLINAFEDNRLKPERLRRSYAYQNG